MEHQKTDSYNQLSSVEVLFEMNSGERLPLPKILERLYGRLCLPAADGYPYVFANFVSTLDGVVTLGIPGKSGGGEISGFNPHDRMIMGLLRAAADAVIVGSGTLKASPQTRWTPGYIYPDFKAIYRELRTQSKKSEEPLNVIVTGSGDLDLNLPVFQDRDIPVLIVTSEFGAERIRRQPLPESVQVKAVRSDGKISAAEILTSVQAVCEGTRFLLEGGPHLLSIFLAEQQLDELFLTLAPQVAGREGSPERLGLVAGHNFAPDNPKWSTLLSLRKTESHLFLRYAFRSSHRKAKEM